MRVKLTFGGEEDGSREELSIYFVLLAVSISKGKIVRTGYGYSEQSEASRNPHSSTGRYPRRCIKSR